MKNLNQSGKVMALVAPYDRLSGQGALVGSQFGVAVSDVLSTVSGQFLTKGIVTLAKTDSQAWVQGDKIYWDDTNKRCDNTVVGPCIGTAAAAVAATAGLVTGSVKLKDAPAVVPGAAEVTIGTANATDLATSEALANALKVTVNSLLAKLRTAGIILP